MTTRDFVPLTQYTELRHEFLKLNDRRNKLEIDIRELAKLVLKLSPERKEWLEKHYGEYL